MHNINNPKRATPQSSKNRQRRHSPQNKLEVKVFPDRSTAVGLADGHAEDCIADHPAHDHVGAHGAVVIFLLLGLADAVFGDFEAIAKVAQSFVVAGVDVELLRRHF